MVKRAFILFALLAPAVCAAADAARPRLVLFIVVDQMRADYLNRLHRKSPLGRRLARATVFTHAVHDHVPTTTSPGHAAIATGLPPSINGIAANDRYDRATGTLRSTVSDPKRGAGPFQLAAKTLSDAVKAATPAAIVVSVSLKDRSAILLGGQRPDAAVWYDQNRQRFVTGDYYGPVPAWAEAENEGLPALVKTVTSPFAENDFEASPVADRAVVSLSTRAIAALALGADAVCDLLLVSLSATDTIGHRWGPGSAQMTRQLAELEGNLEALIAAAEAASGGRLTVAITSDHGALEVPESVEGRRIGARRVVISDFQMGMEAALQGAFPARGRRWISAFQPPDLFLNRGLAKDLNIPWNRFLKEAAEALRQTAEVAAVYVPGEASADPFAAVYRRSWLEDASGDLQIRTASFVLLSRWPTGTSHGTPYPYDAVVPAIFLGTGGAPVRVAREISVESISPTVAAAMGVPFAPGEAPVLPEALPPRGR